MAFNLTKYVQNDFVVLPEESTAVVDALKFSNFCINLLREGVVEDIIPKETFPPGHTLAGGVRFRIYINHEGTGVVDISDEVVDVGKNLSLEIISIVEARVRSQGQVKV